MTSVNDAGLIGDGTTADLSEDDVFEVLSNRRRRYAFHYLKREGREVFLVELAEQIAAWENEKPVDQLSAPEKNRVKTALRQHHLPRMASHQFVEYDSGRGTVELSSAAAELDVYLDVVPGRDVPWAPVYLGVGVVAVAVAVAAGTVPAVSGVAAAGFVAAAVVVVAAVHTYFTYARLRFGRANGPPDDGRW